MISSFVDTQFDDGYILTKEEAMKIRKMLMEALKNGLSEEAHRIDVLTYILEDSIEYLRRKKVEL